MAETEKKRAFRVPHVYTIILVLMAVFAVLTWIVPSGSFERQEVNGREVTVSGTYEPVDKVYTDEDGNEVDLRQGVFAVLEAPAVGIQQAVEVVSFILIVGGSFQVITATGAITSGVARVVKKFKSKDVLIIPILMVLFALGGSTFGMAEETLPFFAILMPIMMSMGFDSITAFMTVFVGARIGYIASTVNPFNVLISQGILGIQGNPQLWLRTIALVVLTAVAVAWVVVYALKVKKNPEASPAFHDDIEKRKEFGADESLLDSEFTGKQKAVMVIFVLGLCRHHLGLGDPGLVHERNLCDFLGHGPSFGHCFWDEREGDRRRVR